MIKDVVNEAEYDIADQIAKVINPIAVKPLINITECTRQKAGHLDLAVFEEIKRNSTVDL